VAFSADAAAVDREAPGFLRDGGESGSSAAAIPGIGRRDEDEHNDKDGREMRVAPQWRPGHEAP